MNDSQFGAYSFEPYERSRRWMLISGITGVALMLVTLVFMVPGKSYTAGGWRIVEGVMMIGAALSCFAFALSFIRLAMFRCPRCRQAFFCGFASGNQLYGFAMTCQNCGLPLPGRNAS